MEVTVTYTLIVALGTLRLRDIPARACLVRMMTGTGNPAVAAQL
jgi:hypothetical protein